MQAGFQNYFPISLGNINGLRTNKASLARQTEKISSRRAIWFGNLMMYQIYRGQLSTDF